MLEECFSKYLIQIQIKDQKSPYCAVKKTCSSFSFVSTLYLLCQCTAAQWGKSFYLLSPKFQASGFLLPGILYPLLAQDQLLPAAPYTLRFCQRIPQFPVHPFLMVDSLLTSSYTPFSCWLGVSPTGKVACVPAYVRELHQALETGRMCQELSFKLALQICPCSVQH